MVRSLIGEGGISVTAITGFARFPPTEENVLESPPGKFAGTPRHTDASNRLASLADNAKWNSITPVKGVIGGFGIVIYLGVVLEHGGVSVAKRVFQR